MTSCGSGKKYKKCCMNKEKMEEIISEEIEEKNTEKTIDYEIINNFVIGFQKIMLENKPHIKEYKKIRKLHSEILDSMMNYNESGKFKQEWSQPVNKNEIMNFQDITIITNEYDTSTKLGEQAFANVLIYKNSKYMNCLTEEYINKNKFRKKEKVDFLNSMLNSVAGLFEVLKTDRSMGKVYLKDVLTKKQYCITDIGLSSNFNNDDFYFYTRIITYNNVSMGTGLNIVFGKKDQFINKWIKENTKEYNNKEEIRRFMEVYSEYSKNDKGSRTNINTIM